MSSATSQQAQTSITSSTTGSAWTGATTQGILRSGWTTRSQSSDEAGAEGGPDTPMTRRIRSTVWLILVPVAALLGIGSLPAGAQPIRYGISPGELELAPASGGTASAVLVVYNKAANTARMRVAVQDLNIRPDGVTDVLAPGKLRWSVAGFTRVQP